MPAVRSRAHYTRVLAVTIHVLTNAVVEMAGVSKGVGAPRMLITLTRLCVACVGPGYHYKSLY